MQPSNILIIDDERVIRDGCHLALSGRGHSVDICMNGRDGLETILKGSYDLALLDMKLPDMDGMDILRTVEREKLGVYVIVMTGYSTVQNAVEAMKQGAFDYLAKPFSDDELVLAVERAIEKKRLVEENLALRHQLSERFDFSNIIGENPRILKIFNEIQKVAPTNSTVLLHGESGTGKELFSRAIHAHSRRATRQFVAVDCSTFSSSLLESELFGHVKGAFTGAIKDKAGIFDEADHGSLFLDEVGNLDTDIQAKLLRAIETQEFKPVGASHLKKSDVRIIAATNRDLKMMVDEGNFREDLFYRLNVFPIFIPPLRERKDDIPRLLYHFLKVYCRQIGKQVDGFSDDALETLVNHDWPGNVRQLKNVVERLVIIADDRVLDYQSLSDHWEMKRNRTRDAVPETLEELKSVKRQMLENQFGKIERAFLQKALSAADGNITQAARRVGIQRSNFSALMKKHHLSANSAKMTSKPGDSMK
ncbi:MAG: response regulator protein [Desulfobacteraceae bacterium 4484_190.2]|nr:MAG: response regulator protein [Desulfobacteraceae bacterium 4484_190.2]